MQNVVLDAKQVAADARHELQQHTQHQVVAQAHPQEQAHVLHHNHTTFLSTSLFSPSSSSSSSSSFLLVQSCINFKHMATSMSMSKGRLAGGYKTVVAIRPTGLFFFLFPLLFLL